MNDIEQDGMRIQGNICNRRNNLLIPGDSLWVGEKTVFLLEVSRERKACPKFLPVPNAFEEGKVTPDWEKHLPVFNR